LRKYADASSKTKQIFDICKDIALQSQMRSKHCAALVRNGKIITIDCNYYGSDKNSFSVHSESNLQRKISKVSYKLKDRCNYSLYVVRYSKSSGFMNSKPCSECAKCIKSSMPYVNKVFYSYDNDTYICKNKIELDTNHVSLGYRFFKDVDTISKKRNKNRIRNKKNNKNNKNRK